jgi:hypothetical protein
MTRMTNQGRLRRSLVAVVAVLSAPALQGAELQPKTVEAFDRYVRLTEARMEPELRGGSGFLYVDRLPPAQRDKARAALSRGEVFIERLHTRDGGREVDVPDGLIHHWVGVVFVPRATVERAASLMQAYEKYPDLYAPNVQRAGMIRRDGDRFQVRLRLFMKKVISVVLDTDNDVTYTRLDGSRLFVRGYTTRIAEVQDAGTTQEHEAPVGRDGGYLWRFNNYCSLSQNAEGSFVQCESLSLSRGIPFGLGWLIGPFVTSIPRESLEFTLTRLRANLT